MKRFRIRIHIAQLFLVVTLVGCSDTLARLESKPNALGSTNEVVVIADSAVWQSATRDTIEFYFESPYPIMPTPEPLFDLRHFTTEDLQADRLRKELRTYLYVADLNDSESATTKAVIEDLGAESVRRARENQEYITTAGLDKWARGQLVVYVFGFGQEDLQDKIIRAFPRISERIRSHDESQLKAATYLNGVSQNLSTLVKSKFGLSMEIPGDYKLAVEDDNFLWIRKDTRDLTSNIAIRKFRYQSEEQLDLEGIINMRNRLGVLIQGSSIGSFMRTNNQDLPVFTYKKEMDGLFAIESRGIWELTEDYLGGPFINYVLVQGDEIIMIDGFAYAPGKGKRDFVQQLEYVISRLEVL